MTDAASSPVADFVERLARLAPADRASIAQLRRGAGRPVGEPAAAAAVFYRLRPPGGRLEAPAWLAATLWARHPSHVADKRSVGAALRQIPTGHGGPERALRRLLASDADELPAALLRAVSLLRSAGVTLDYEQLIWDVHHWQSHDRNPRRAWARDFYAAETETTTAGKET